MMNRRQTCQMNQGWKAFIISLLGAGSLLIPALAPAQVTTTKEGFLFRKKFSEGDAWVYHVETKVTMGEGRRAPKGGSNSLSTLTVKGLQGKSAILELSDAPVKKNERPTTAFTLKVDELGRIEGSPVGGGVVGFALPEKPVKVGDKFNIRLESGAGNKDIIQHTVKFVGFTTLSKQKVARWDVITAGKGSSVLTGTGAVYLNITDGSLYQSQMNLTAIVQRNGQPVRVVMATTITLK